MPASPQGSTILTAGTPMQQVCGQAHAPPEILSASGPDLTDPRRARAVSRPAASQEAKPLKIGVNTAFQLQVGRDAIDGAKIAEINAQGGVLGANSRL
jgi:hypothetical protein